MPAYPADATDVAVLRIVVREGLGPDLADELLADMRDAVDHREQYPPGHESGRRLQPHLTGCVAPRGDRPKWGMPAIAGRA